MLNIIGKHVREARHKFKPTLTQEELAARLQVAGWKISRESLAKIETGMRTVTDIELMALAKTLKVSAESLLDKQAFESLRPPKKKRG